MRLLSSPITGKSSDLSVGLTPGLSVGLTLGSSVGLTLGLSVGLGVGETGDPHFAEDDEVVVLADHGEVLRRFSRHVLAQGAVSEQLLHRNVQRFRGGLVFEAHKLLYHST